MKEKEAIEILEQIYDNGEIPLNSDPAFKLAIKALKNQMREKELKEMIVSLRMALVNANIPYGNCPYSYYSTSKQKSRENCGDISCSECKRNFLEVMREDIVKEVEQL